MFESNIITERKVCRFLPEPSELKNGAGSPFRKQKLPMLYWIYLRFSFEQQRSYQHLSKFGFCEVKLASTEKSSLIRIYKLSVHVRRTSWKRFEIFSATPTERKVSIFETSETILPHFSFAQKDPGSTLRIAGREPLWFLYWSSRGHLLRCH